MGAIDISLVNDLVAALVCGAFIGLERERGKSAAHAEADEGTRKRPEPPEARHLAGIRTHILVAILGALMRLLDRGFETTESATVSAPFAWIGLASLSLYIVAAYAVRAARTGHYGMTSVPTLLITYAIGVLCLSGQRPLALSLAVVVTGILAVKAPLHRFVRALTGEEIAAGVKFGLLALVLLPLLPDRDFGPKDWPWLAARLQGVMQEETLARLSLVNPYKLWLLVVLISGIGFVGYVLVKVLGPQRGLVATGFAGGLVSSTSVTLAMAEQSRHTPKWKDSIAAAVLAACTVMAIRVLVVAVAIHPSLLGMLGAPLGALMLTSLVVTFILSRRAGRPGVAKTEGAVAVTTPLAIGPALQLAGLIFLVRVLSEVAVLLIGDAGLVLMAAISGVVDVDALNIAASQQAKSGQVAMGYAVVAICVAVAVNTIAKGLFVLLRGDRATGRTTLIALLITLVGAAAGFVGALLLRGGLA